MEYVSEDKKDEIVLKAINCFWEKVAEEFPDIKHGDIDPKTVIDFEEAAYSAIDNWINLNK